MALDIVEELRQDREKGAKRLESEYKAGLMTLAMRFCSSQSDAEELVNRTFAAVVAGIDDYLEQSAFFGWMCQILKNLHSLDMRRKSNRCEVCTGDVPETADDDALEAIYRSLDRSIVRAAIETLEPEEKEALLLHYFMDIPIKRMAKILAAPEGTVKRRLHFARKALAAKLGVAAMKFQTAESGKCGGALHAVTKSSDIYGSTANAITVEAFVCTTGGVFSTFAPIVACMQYENWTSEKWAIYEETDGTLALRFDGTPYYSGNSGQAGTAKINDGAWHHVAFTWDGSTVKIFVDYEQDKFKGSGNARQFTKTTTLGYNYGGQWDYTRIGGYKGQENETTVWRRFNGLVDEVRVSNVALTPDKFLRMQPLDMDGARSAPMSTGGSPTAGRTSTPAPHRTSCRFSSAADTKATPDGSPSSSSTAGSTIYV